ncbi:hypothetical protein ACFWOJ_39295 [Streptomyces sp. NPDC058439]|uniref:hypothetical protein n=1 Tax=Streptomyces sp. NPDC058439 TaxID=3346500 RepID=UPI00365630E5
MGNFEFEMEPLRADRLRGYRGVVGPFGSVDVFSVLCVPGQDPSRQAQLQGDQFPETLFSGGAGVLPSLDGGWLKVDGSLVDMELKVKGVRKGSRWLELTYRERHYTYVSGGDFKEARLHREKATVTMGRGRHVPRTGGTRIGKAEGDVDATDLAIVLVLEKVDKSALTTSGALLAVPMNFLFGRQRDEGDLA